MLENLNITIFQTHTALNHLISFKIQFANNLFQKYFIDRVRYFYAMNISSSNLYISIDQLLFEYQSIPLDRLSEYCAKIGGTPRLWAALHQIEVADKNLSSLILKRKNDPYKFQSMPKKEFLQNYFGSLDNKSNTLYPDIIKSIKETLDDAIFFCYIIFKELQLTQKNIRSSTFVKNNPKIFSQIKDHGISMSTRAKSHIPSPRYYKLWLPSYPRNLIKRTINKKSFIERVHHLFKR